VAVCASCGQESPDGFRFCGACGASLVVEARPGVRKTVTVLFCDVTGSTWLGESVDPEALRMLLAR
jgi:class 3 adenylate cyclase